MLPSPALERRPWSTKLGPALALFVTLAIAVMLSLVLVAAGLDRDKAAASSSAVASATASTDGSAPHLLSVRFDLSTESGASADGAGGPLSAAGGADRAAYAGVQIEHRLEARRLRPWDGPFGVAVVSEGHAVSAEIDGLRLGAGSDGVGAALEQTVSSTSLQSFIRIDTGRSDVWATVDLQLPHGLASGDYVLIQEAGGDASIEVQGLDANGQPVGPGQLVTAPYTWNTGHLSADGVGQWATVIAPPGLGVGPQIEGLRLRASRAEVKVVVLGPAPSDGSAPGDQVTSTDDALVEISTGDDSVVGAAAVAGGTSEPAAPVDGVEPVSLPAPDATQTLALPEPDAEIGTGTGTGTGTEPATETSTETEPASQPEPEALTTGLTQAAPPVPAIDLRVGVLPAVAVGGAGCDEAVAAADGARPGQGTSTFCFAVTNTGPVAVTGVSVTDARAGLVDAVLPRASGPEILAPGDRAVFYHHATPSAVLASQPIRAEAKAVGAGLAAQASAGSAGAADGGSAPAEADTPSQTALAMTGVPTDPWVMVALATGLIFFGYTTIAAYRRPVHRPDVDQNRGHDLLDELGFE